MGRDYISELSPQTGIFFIPHVIHEYEELLWNDTDRVEPKNSKKNLSQCHSAHHKSHMHWSGREPEPLLWEASD
jgi:hypothetical protein